jgi:hypothetical protein
MEEFREKPKGRNRELTYDHWMIYDKVKFFRKKDFVGIAKELSGLTGYPSSNEKLMAAYMRVKRAFEKGEKIIKIVRQEIAALNV